MIIVWIALEYYVDFNDDIVDSVVSKYDMLLLA